MKALKTTFVLLFVFFVRQGFAQFESVQVNIIDDLQVYHNRNIARSTSSSTKCTGDTLDYVRYKATAYNSIAIRSGSSIGQYYPVPKHRVTVTGFSFYSWSIDSLNVDLVCNLYKAGQDSLPTGSPLAADTIRVDSTFGNGLLSVLEKVCVFDTARTIDFPFIITVGTIQASRRAGVVANSWTANDGDNENLLCGSVSGTWYNGLNLNIGGATLNADAQFYPFVSYTLRSSFDAVDTCYNPADTVKFINHSRDSSVTGNKFYNRYLYYKDRYNNQFYENLCYRWNYGHNSSYYSNVEGANKYGTPSNYKVTMITANYSYRSGTCYDTSYLDIKFKPYKPTLYGGNTACEGDSITITASSVGVSDYKWYWDPMDSLPYQNKVDYNTGSKPVTDTVYVKAYNGNCVSDIVRRIYSINEIPDDPNVTHDSVCTQSKANLSASANIGDLYWFNSPSGGASFHQGEVYQTAILSGDYTVYVEAINKGCLSPNRVPVTAYVSSSFAPKAPTVTADTTLCLRSTGTIQLNATVSTSDTLRWYSVPSGGNPIHYGSNYAYTPSGIGKTSYYIDAWNGTCASTREAINIETQDYPDFFKTISDTICKGEDAELIGYVFRGKTFWYTSSTGGMPIDSGNALSLSSPPSSTIYYAETKEGVCTSPTREAVNLVVNTYAPFTELNTDEICSKSKAQLSVAIAEGEVSWYTEPVAGNPVHSGLSYTTPELLYTTAYYVESKNHGCVSPREEIIATVNKRPVAGFDYNLRWPGIVECNSITLTGVQYFWDLGDGSTSNNTNIKHTYDTYGDYDIMQVLTSMDNGCKDTSIVELTIDFSSNKDISTVRFELYPNPNNGTATVQSPAFKDGEQWILVIQDALGRIIQNDALLVSNNKIPLKIREKGLFIVSLRNKQQLINSRILVK